MALCAWRSLWRTAAAIGTSARSVLVSFAVPPHQADDDRHHPIPTVLRAVRGPGHPEARAKREGTAPLYEHRPGNGGKRASSG